LVDFTAWWDWFEDFSAGCDAVFEVSDLDVDSHEERRDLFERRAVIAVVVGDDCAVTLRAIMMSPAKAKLMLFPRETG